MDFNRRCFAFGCSLTNHTTVTVSDALGHHFKEYHNLGQPGASNRWIADRFFEAVSVYDLRPDRDHIVFQTTGWGRYSGYDLHTDRWILQGDILQPQGQHQPEHWIPEVSAFNHRTAVFNSAVSIRSVVTYLRNLGFQHTVIPGMAFFELFDPRYRYKFSGEDYRTVFELEQFLGTRRRYVMDFVDQHRGITIFGDSTDQHPNLEEVREYLRVFLPDFDPDVVEQYRDLDLLNTLRTQSPSSARLWAWRPES